MNKQRVLGLGSLKVASSGTVKTESREESAERRELPRVRNARPDLVRYPWTPSWVPARATLQNAAL